jgi:ribose-phosphate pyrophosphokinase
MIIIDSDNYAAQGIETMFFSGGEPHVKVPIFKEDLLLHLKLRTWEDVGLAVCLCSALTHQKSQFTSFIPYFPGARQDRSDGTAPFTLSVMTNLLYHRKIAVFDPHSDMLKRYMPFTAFMPVDIPVPAWTLDVVGIIAPDEGATDRAAQFLDKFWPNADLIQGYKERDPQTGKIIKYDLDIVRRKGTYIIVDDICDGGGTFNLTADHFYSQDESNGCNLEMFISHGIFSAGLTNITPRIRRITTTDSWCRIDYPYAGKNRLTVIPLLPTLMSKLENI